MITNTIKHIKTRLLLLAVVLWCTVTAVQAQTNYFRIVGGIPHLPAVASTGAVATPLPGMMVYSVADGNVRLYTGSAWSSFCTTSSPGTLNSETWFRVVNGIPCLPVQAALTGVAPSGAIYYPTGGTGLSINNGTAWNTVAALNAQANITVNATAAMGSLTGIAGGFTIPVLSSVPTGITAGAVYIDAATADLKVYSGSVWLAIDCSSCAPQVAGVYIAGDFASMASNAFSNGGYAYYDKEGDPEITSAAYRWFFSSAANGAGTTTPLSASADYIHTYTDADDGKYLNLGVTVHAGSGNPTSDEGIYSALLKNCPPLADVARIDMTDWTFPAPITLQAGYAYFDKENNTEGASVIEWFRSDDATGTNKTSLGTGSYIYTFSDADQDKYLSFAVTPKATTGFSTGTPTLSPYYQIWNCPPQAVSARVETTDKAIFYAGYAYFDKEGNAEDATTIEWFRSDDGAGTNKTSVGTAITYTSTGDDANKYLSFVVTPKTTVGYTTGNPVISDYYPVGTNCPPQATGLLTDISDWTYSSATTLQAGYTYYDKDDNAEGGSVIEWFKSDDASGTNKTSLGTGSSYEYTFSEADNGKYLSFAVTPMATAGFTTGLTAVSYFQIWNCPPQAIGAIVETTDNLLFQAGYTYYDKEANTEGASVIEWFRSDNATGTNKISLGTGSSYTYVEADNAKYLSFTVTPKAGGGYSIGTPISSPYFFMGNCPPQVNAVMIDLADWTISAGTALLQASYVYYDREGNAEGSSAIEFFKSDDAAGLVNKTSLGTGSSYNYTYSDTDNGKYLSFTLTPKAATGMITGTIVSSPYYQVGNCAPQANGAMIDLADWAISSGTALLQASYVYYDKENNTEGASIVEWFKSDDASGTNKASLGTGSSYNYPYIDADQGKYLSFAVTPKAATGYTTGTTIFSPYYQVSNCAPQVSGAMLDMSNWTFTAPTDLKASYVFYDRENSPEGASIVEWFKSDDATGTNKTSLGTGSYNYTYSEADQNKYLSFAVTPKATIGYSTGSQTSSPYYKIWNSPPKPTGTFVAGDLTNMGSNTFTVGYTYQDDEGDLEVAGAQTYRWFLSTGNGGTGAITELSTSNSYAYTFTDADNGKYLNLTISVKAATGYPSSGEYTGSYLLQNCLPQATGVSVNGTLAVGNTLIAGYIYYDKEGNTESGTAFQWYRATSAAGAGATAIGGATSISYVLTAEDVGSYIGVAVTPKAGSGYSTGSPVVSDYYLIP